MKLDWNFIAKNLAEHLAAVAEAATIERILEEAQANARRLDAPAHFWDWVTSAYRDHAQRAGRGTSAQIIDTLRRLRHEAA